MSGRRLFIGDIQGCREELERLLEAVRFDPAADELHPVGDLINRGPDSLGTLRLLHQLDAGGVLGNHDVHALRVHAGTRRPGRRDTLDELLAAEDREVLFAWLAARPFLRAWDDLLCVHAGLHPGWEDPATALVDKDPFVQDPHTDFATRVRYCSPDGTRPVADWPPPPAPYAAWDEHWRAKPDESRTVVFGHWARRGLEVRPRTRALDAGCVWGRALACWNPEEDRLVQVPAARVWCAPSAV